MKRRAGVHSMGGCTSLLFLPEDIKSWDKSWDNSGDKSMSNAAYASSCCGQYSTLLHPDSLLWHDNNIYPNYNTAIILLGNYSMVNIEGFLDVSISNYLMSVCFLKATYIWQPAFRLQFPKCICAKCTPLTHLLKLCKVVNIKWLISAVLSQSYASMWQNEEGKWANRRVTV